MSKGLEKMNTFKTFTTSINKYNLWVWMLFFSFAYEKPVFFIASIDKVNPRLFDLVLLVGMFFLLKHPMKYSNPIFKLWLYLVSWFSVVTILGLIIFSFDGANNQFMVYFLFEYYKGILAVIIFLSIPKDRYSIKTIISAIIIGGLFVSLYCINEFNTGVTEIIISGTKSMLKPAGMVWGPYVGSYFEIAVYVPLSFTIALVSMFYIKKINRLWLVLIVLLIAWPVLFTGSRTAIFLLLLSFIIVILKSPKRSTFILIPLSIIIIGLFTFTNVFNVLLQQNETIERLQGFESSKSNQKFNSIESRLLIFKHFDVTSYDEANSLPIIGAGFYVAPINGLYRVGYGIHNIYLFPLEQAGIIGLILFLLFIYISITILLRGMRVLSKDSIEYWFVLAVFSYFIASLLIGLSGHTFWRGFTTYNFNTLRILLLVYASILIYNREDQINEKNTIS